MRKLRVFNSISLDGYFTDDKNDMSWAHGRADAEWNEFVNGNASGGAQVLFGRVTYAMMASYWQSPQAMQDMPVVAKQMNALPKLVFSRTLDRASWQNTELVKGDLPDAVRKLKSEPGRDMMIFGSGQIVAQLADENLIDEYEFVIVPVVVGRGRTLFEGMKKRSKIALRRTSSREFKNGNVFVCYVPAE